MVLYSVSGSVLTLNSASMSLVGFGGFHFFRKLIDREGKRRKGGKIQNHRIIRVRRDLQGSPSPTPKIQENTGNTWAAKVTFKMSGLAMKTNNKIYKTMSKKIESF